MRALKRHSKLLLLMFGVAQLAYLLSTPYPLMAASLLIRAVLSGHYTLYVLLAPCLLAFGVVFNKRVKALDCRWLEWSPWHVKTNFALMPLRNSWLWVPYALLLGACMPLLAFFEEVIFRNGTTGWVRGLLWGAIAFGLFHLLSLVSIRMVLYLAIVGAVLVEVYFQDGLLAVFVVHAVYNLLVLILVIVDLHVKRAPRLMRRLGHNVYAASETSQH
jgi:hypothetical protein